MRLEVGINHTLSDGSDWCSSEQESDSEGEDFVGLEGRVMNWWLV